MSAFCWLYKIPLDEVTEYQQDSCSEHGCYCDSCPYFGDESDVPLYPEE